MPNIENINLLIKTIAAQPAKLLQMRDYSQPVGDCGTAHCVGGWIQVLVRGAEDRHFGDRERAKWLGVGQDELNDIEYMVNARISLGDFDRNSDEKRQAAALAMLEILRDTGEVDWPASLRKAGIGEY